MAGAKSSRRGEFKLDTIIDLFEENDDCEEVSIVENYVALINEVNNYYAHYFGTRVFPSSAGVEFTCGGCSAGIHNLCSGEFCDCFSCLITDPAADSMFESGVHN